jgi:putative membrane protein
VLAVTSSPTLLLGHAGPPPVTLALLAIVGVVALVVVVGAVNGTRAMPWWRSAATLVGLAALAVALSPPVEEASETSFSAHMVQHLLFTAVAATLLVVGRAGLALRRGLWRIIDRRPPRAPVPTSVTRWLTSGSGALVAAIVASAVMLVWHIPAPYEAAVADEWLHGFEHATLFGTAVWMWAAVLLVRSDPHLAVLAVLINALAHAVLGGLLTFARRPLYEPYVAAGLSDQQLAGLLMWVPAGAVHLVVASTLVVGWMARSRLRVERRELARREAVLTATTGRSTA